MPAAPGAASMAGMPAAPERPVRPLRPVGVLEALASLGACGLVLLLPLLWFGAHLCAFGECSVPGAEDVRHYRLTVGAIASLVALALVLAVRRRARLVLAWHCTVGLVAVVASLAFAMPSIDWQQLRQRHTPSSPDYVPCYSGPPNDCPGG